MNKVFICPLCDFSNAILCKQPHGYASITRAEKKVAFNGQILYHEICKECGTVVRSFIENPEKL
ncbi:hypothetical protein [Streptococcus ruminantium]|uniref:hypothetical protein n=1 Tax=Streptococcus ruminantium TaxID=1917441 RepID=UPI0012DF6024|nr:hypothetical protein [Streptococcus ruminantium]